MSKFPSIVLVLSVVTLIFLTSNVFSSEDKMFSEPQDMFGICANDQGVMKDLEGEARCISKTGDYYQGNFTNGLLDGSAVIVFDPRTSERGLVKEGLWDGGSLVNDETPDYSQLGEVREKQGLRLIWFEVIPNYDNVDAYLGWRSKDFVFYFHNKNDKRVTRVDLCAFLYRHKSGKYEHIYTLPMKDVTGGEVIGPNEFKRFVVKNGFEYQPGTAFQRIFSIFDVQFEEDESF